MSRKGQCSSWRWQPTSAPKLCSSRRSRNIARSSSRSRAAADLRRECARLALDGVLQRRGQVTVEAAPPLTRQLLLRLDVVKAQQAEHTQDEDGRRGAHAALADHFQSALCGQQG